MCGLSAEAGAAVASAATTTRSTHRKRIGPRNFATAPPAPPGPNIDSRGTSAARRRRRKDEAPLGAPSTPSDLTLLAAAERPEGVAEGGVLVAAVLDRVRHGPQVGLRGHGLRAGLEL